MLEQEVKGDPAIPCSMRVTKRFKVDGKTFSLVLARATASGPYLVTATGHKQK